MIENLRMDELMLDLQKITEGKIESVRRETFYDLECIASGASSNVFKAKNEAGNTVILKECCPSQIYKSGSIRRNAQTHYLELNFSDRSWVSKKCKAEWEKASLNFEKEWESQTSIQKSDQTNGNNNASFYYGGDFRVPYIVMNYDGELMKYSGIKNYQNACLKAKKNPVFFILRMLRDYAKAISKT